MKKIFLFSFMIFIASFLFVVNYALAQEFPWNNVPMWDVGYVADILKIPRDFMQLPNFIWYLLVPFIAIWAICLGFLRQLRIFPRTPSLEIIIAFTMAFATLPSGVFVIAVNGMLAFSGVWATAIFFIMFLGGTGLYFLHWPGWTFRAGGLERDIMRLTREREQIDNQITAAQNAGNDVEVQRLTRRRDALDVQLRRRNAELAGIEAHERERYQG
jgi:hypothetical protein